MYALIADYLHRYIRLHAIKTKTYSNKYFYKMNTCTCSVCQCKRTDCPAFPLCLRGQVRFACTFPSDVHTVV